MDIIPDRFYKACRTERFEEINKLCKELMNIQTKNGGKDVN